ncbi:MAG: hypothetical protein AAB690_02050 [Patescibacteria group bacterium]
MALLEEDISIFESEDDEILHQDYFASGTGGCFFLASGSGGVWGLDWIVVIRQSLTRFLVL